MTSLEGRVLRRRRAISPPAGVRSELDVLAELATRLGSMVHFDTDPSLVFDELARASAGGRADYSGLSHARLDEQDDLYWPCPADQDGERHPGTPRLFLDRFGWPDGKARMIPVDRSAPATMSNGVASAGASVIAAVMAFARISCPPKSTSRLSAKYRK